MVLPPDLVATAVAVTTSAVANTATTGTVVATPGAGSRLRLWGYLAIPNATSQAATNWRSLATNGVGGAVLTGLSSANFASYQPSWVPGGLALATNTALGYLIQSALVSLNLSLIAWTTTEVV